MPPPPAAPGVAGRLWPCGRCFAREDVGVVGRGMAPPGLPALRSKCGRWFGGVPDLPSWDAAMTAQPSGPPAPCCAGDGAPPPALGKVDPAVLASVPSRARLTSSLCRNCGGDTPVLMQDAPGPRELPRCNVGEDPAAWSCPGAMWVRTQPPVASAAAAAPLHEACPAGSCGGGRGRWTCGGALAWGCRR
eukprot:1145425-Pelagomonas_calceolata.AAC.6